MTEPFQLELADILPALKRDLSALRFKISGKKGERVDLDLTLDQATQILQMLVNLSVERGIRLSPIWNVRTGEQQPPLAGNVVAGQENLVVMLCEVLSVHRLPESVVAIDVRSTQNHLVRLVLSQEQAYLLATALPLGADGAA